VIKNPAKKPEYDSVYRDDSMGSFDVWSEVYLHNYLAMGLICQTV